MKIEQAKAIPISEILQKLELTPAKANETDATYYSPFREERTPSFHVNKKENIWYDHGAGIGGNAFDLVLQILANGGHSHLPADALRWLRNTNLDPSLPKPCDRVKNRKSKWKTIRVTELEDLRLIRYLTQRGIDVKLAQKYVSEIYIRKKDSPVKLFAIGFKNEDGGYELRNKFIKSCVAPKTISFIRADIPKPQNVMLFEGFMDFLTYVTIKKGVLSCDNIILSSVACVDHAFRYIKNYGYRYAFSWMDNDNAGIKARERIDEFIKAEPGLTHRPLNRLYSGHKDLNAWHMANHNLSPV